MKKKSNYIYVQLNSGELRKFDITNIPEDEIWKEAEKVFGEDKVKRVGKLSPMLTKEDKKIAKDIFDRAIGKNLVQVH